MIDEELMERIESPEEELKRADHLVFVSLKYTRTCDIMMNAIKRLINAYDMVIDEYLDSLKEKKKLKEIPNTTKEKAALARKLLGNSAKKYMLLYNLMKIINKCEYSRIDEFRKNVTLKTKGTKSVSIKMEDVHNFLDTASEFVKFMRLKIGS